MHKVTIGAKFGAEIERPAEKAHKVAMRGIWRTVCIGADGKEKWVEDYTNIVLDAALDDLLDSYLVSGTQTTSWFVGLKATGTVSGTQTLGTHSAWATTTPRLSGTTTCFSIHLKVDTGPG